MKHGVAFRKLSRTSSHRMLMLRNLVTSLFEHEQIQTTLPKARDTARLAEKIITLGKKGDLPAFRRASAFILQPSLVPKVFATFAQRYATRPGGYTRIHKYGNRPGDNAPNAVVELVDNPRDLRFAMTARAVGWETLALKLEKETVFNTVNRGVPEVAEVVKRDKDVPYGSVGLLKERTRTNMRKALRYRGEGGVQELIEKATDYVDHMLARPVAYVNMKGHDEKKTKVLKETIDLEAPLPKDEKRATVWMQRNRAGDIYPGETASADMPVLRTAQGVALKPRKVKWFESRRAARPKLGIHTAGPS